MSKSFNCQTGESKSKATETTECFQPQQPSSSHMKQGGNEVTPDLTLIDWPHQYLILKSLRVLSADHRSPSRSSGLTRSESMLYGGSMGQLNGGVNVYLPDYSVRQLTHLQIIKVPSESFCSFITQTTAPSLWSLDTRVRDFLSFIYLVKSARYGLLCVWKIGIFNWEKNILSIFCREAWMFSFNEWEMYLSRNLRISWSWNCSVMIAPDEKKNEIWELIPKFPVGFIVGANRSLMLAARNKRTFCSFCFWLLYGSWFVFWMLALFKGSSSRIVTVQSKKQNPISYSKALISVLWWRQSKHLVM